MITTGADLLREVGQSLATHRLRATLATAGIVAGVGTVVAALSIAEGARQAAMADLGALGTDSVIVRAHDRVNAKGARLEPLLTFADANTFRQRLPGSTSAAVRLTHDVVTAGPRSAAAPLVGVTTDWFSSARLEVARGRSLRSADDDALCAVVGDTLGHALFGAVDPVGQSVFAGGEWRTVVGVLASGAAKPRSSLQIVSTDDAVIVPFATLDLSLGVGDRGDAATEIILRLPAGDDPVLAATVVERVLADRRDDGNTAFDVLVPKELLRARLRAQRSSQVLLLSIGVLALLISGVGIVNIMIASVTERTAEIGVRRAVGARRGAVLALFAGEALALGVAGGAIGVPAGVVAAWLSAHAGGWPVAISLGDIGGALALALGTALGAGLYPAHLAASIAPIDALRA